MARVFREGKLTTLYGQWTFTKRESKETQLVKETPKSLKRNIIIIKKLETKLRVYNLC